METDGQACRQRYRKTKPDKGVESEMVWITLHFLKLKALSGFPLMAEFSPRTNLRESRLKLESRSNDLVAFSWLAETKTYGKL